ncbi:MAG: TolC family protein [Magnetococcales bacterium]|nr:TolC family protein [Magnetococcales bacterium]
MRTPKTIRDDRRDRASHPYRSRMLALLAACLCATLPLSAPAAEQPPTATGQPRQRESGLAPLLHEVTSQHERVLKTKAKLEAAEHRAREAVGDWFPSLDFTTSTGGERQLKEGTEDTSLRYREADVKLTQRLWDAGKTDSKVNKAAQALEKAKANHEAALIKLILDGAKAALNVVKHREALQLAKKAEQNILNQAQLEKKLIAAGAGMGTDLLQANAQHAAAETRTIRAEGALVKAENEFRKLFKREMNTPLSLDGLKPHLTEIQPKDLPEAIQTALTRNAESRAARIDVQIAREELSQTRGEKYFPSMNFEMEHKWQDNMAGIEGRKNVSTAGVKLNMPLNLGLTAINSVEASRLELVAAENQWNDTLNSTEEEVRNAWQELITLRAIAVTLERQAKISEGFLELAREERKLGNRSLLDVLSGETSLINAQSDAASARIDVLIGMISLLKSTGQLHLGLFSAVTPATTSTTTAPAPVPSP